MSSLRRLPRLGWLIAIIGFLARALLLGGPHWPSTTRICHGPERAWDWRWPLRRSRSGLSGFRAGRRMSAVAIVLFLGVVAWWISIRPSHDRNWRPEVAVMPRAIIDGDRVRLTGVRNFDYRSRNDFTVRYEEREVQLSHLTALDFYVSYFTRRAGRTHVPEFHLRQRAAAEHLHRDAAGGRRGLCARRLPVQAIRVDLRGG